MANEAAFDLKAYLNEKRAVVDKALRTYLPRSSGPASELNQAMEYSLSAGGKRLRPHFVHGPAPPRWAATRKPRYRLPALWNSSTPTPLFTMTCPPWTTTT